MNGEMHQMCMLVNEARNAMAGRREFAYSCDRYVYCRPPGFTVVSPGKFLAGGLQSGRTANLTGAQYINSVRLRFVPERTFFGEKAREAYSPREWYERCVRKGVDDMKFLAPLQVPDRARLGFSNVSGACMVAFHRDGLVTYWTAAWEYDRTLSKWNVAYRECKWNNAPSEKPRFQDNTEELADILLRIGDFADRIECGYFGKLFHSACDILWGKAEIPQQYANGSPISLPDVPEKNKRMFHAASMADVFGAMGSWNDEPPGCAHLKGLDEAYESLSNELLKQIRLAVLYAVNEDGPFVSPKGK